MYKHGDLTPMPDGAIFADTGAEPDTVYEWLEYLKTISPIPIYVCRKEFGLLHHIHESIRGSRFAGAPFYTESAKKQEGRLKRQCTNEFKIQPIIQKSRELAGLKKGQRARDVIIEQLVGISTDEYTRMKPAREKWIRTRWPLIEKRMSRRDCIYWIDIHGYERPPKSACFFCPYHSNKEWEHMRKYDPESFRKTIDVDRLIRNGVRGTTQKLFLHRSLKPLESIDFRSDLELGQLPLWENECAGICGV